MVTILHGLHLVPTTAALKEAHRLLRPEGVLVAAWYAGTPMYTYVVHVPCMLCCCVVMHAHVPCMLCCLVCHYLSCTMLAPHLPHHSTPRNDRDLASSFILELETLMETFNAAYSRHLKQRDLAHWGEALQQEGLFRLLEYSVHPNPLHLRGAAPLLDILDCLTFMRHSRRPSAERRALHGQVVELVHRYVVCGVWGQ